jgi:SAM-dependent methyltransferase
MAANEPDTQRTEMIARWEHAATGWATRADRILAMGLPVSEWMIDSLGLQPGQRVLELAAGPGDTGFMAAELIRPGGTLICSDAAEAMLEVARSRASVLGIENVEFKLLELEWIDLPTASVDALLCRWGVMLTLDPDAALHEARRVLRPGGRLALAVWDRPEHNPWATIPTRALVEQGHVDPPDGSAPGMFALAAPGRLEELLEGAGFGDVVLDAVPVSRNDLGVEAYIEETLDLSVAFAEVFERLSETERASLVEAITDLAQPYLGADGSIAFPGRSLVAAAGA